MTMDCKGCGSGPSWHVEKQCLFVEKLRKMSEDIGQGWSSRALRLKSGVSDAEC